MDKILQLTKDGSEAALTMVLGRATRAAADVAPFIVDLDRVAMAHTPASNITAGEEDMFTTPTKGATGACMLRVALFLTLTMLTLTER